MARKRSTAGWVALAASMLIAAVPAAAQTVYKLIDKNGKVTYSEEKPKSFDGKVIRMDIDPNANKADLGAPTTDTGGDAAARTREKVKANDAARAQGRIDKLQAARDKLKAAQDAYAEAREHPVDGTDIQYVGNKGGGTRAVPSEAYQKRLGELEHAMKEAEDELHRLTTAN